VYVCIRSYIEAAAASECTGHRTKRLETRSPGGTHVFTLTFAVYADWPQVVPARGMRPSHIVAESSGAKTTKGGRGRGRRSGLRAAVDPSCLQLSSARHVLFGDAYRAPIDAPRRPPSPRPCRLTCVGAWKLSVSLSLCLSLFLAPPALEQLRSLRAGISPRFSRERERERERRARWCQIRVEGRDRASDAAAPIDSFLSSRGRPVIVALRVASFSTSFLFSIPFPDAELHESTGFGCSHRHSGYVTRRREAVGGNSGVVYLVAC